MKITYNKVTKISDEIKVGDIFKRIGGYDYDTGLYMLTENQDDKYSLINLETGKSYSFTPSNTLRLAFGGFRDTFEKVTDPVEIIVG